MLDAELRALERRWRASGSDDDEVAYLRARLRAGAVSAARVAFASYLGHGPARRALPGAPVPGGDIALGAWLPDLRPDLHVAAVRAAIAIAEHERPRWSGDAVAQASFDAAVAWVRAPSEVTRKRARGTARRGDVLRPELSRRDRPDDWPHAAARAAGEDDVHPSGFLGAGSPMWSHPAVRGALVPWLLGHGDPLC